MRGRSRPVKITSFALIGIGLVLLALNSITKGAVNVALPLVFLVLGGVFFILVFSLRSKNPWASFLYIPATLLSAFGLIFLLNVLTQDWKSWAYAWLFLVASVGLGFLLTNREHFWHPSFNVIGWSLTLGGIPLFCLFGAITGGLFIQIMAPVLLVATGLSLRWLNLDQVLQGILSPKSRSTPLSSPPQNPPTQMEELVEPLSTRESEVLKLIIQGLSNQQIADHLSVAPSTIKTHINNIYGKLGVQTRVQAINRARDLNLISN